MAPQSDDLTSGRPHAVLSGTTADGFEAVRRAFSKHGPDRGGAAFSAYVGDQKVVDLWWDSNHGGRPWRQDTLSTVMSASKGLMALCAQLLWDRGELDLDAPVTHYWPEYGQAGKEATLVRHVLTHTSGMLCFEDPGAVLNWEGDGWGDYDEIARRIAASPAAWEPGTQIGYHAISVGWLVQELVRRITGGTLGALFAREFARPLELDIHIGTSPKDQDRLTDITSDELAVQGTTATIMMKAYRKDLHRPGSLPGQAGVYMHGGTFSSNMALFNTAGAREAEIPAANASADARGLARVYAMLAAGGELDGHRIVSRDSIELFRTPARSGRTAVWPRRGLARRLPRPTMDYAMGFEGDFGSPVDSRRFGPSPAAFGHLGAGGQIGLADPERGVSVGFTRSHLTDWTTSTALIAALYGCLQD